MDAGRTLAGRYALLAVIGRGGMGTVYRATDAVLGRTVAVKVLPMELAEGDSVSVARFQREARAAASLVSPSIVAVYDAGVDEGTRFIVMEYVAGRSVEEILRKERRLAPARAVEIALGIADALGAAHAAGIIHRDVKPANVMVAGDGPVKVLDFGVARAIDGTALTHTAAVLGTAAYMAPEQVAGRPADERSDIYSLGCVLYAMIAGRPPFTGETFAAILHQQVNAAPQPLREADPLVPVALDALVMAMLAKSPAARPQSTRELLGRLARACPRPPGRPVGAASATARLPRTARSRLPTVVRSGDPRARRRLVSAGVLACLVLAVLAVALLSSRGSPRSAKHRLAAKQPSGTRPHGTATPTSASTAASTHSTSTAATRPATASGTPPAPPTVAGSAGALTTLLTRDVEGGSTEKHAAQQISNGVTNILNSYEMGHTMNLPHELANLSQQVEMLEGHGQISEAAAPPLHAALATLDTALTKSDPEAEAPTSQPGSRGASAQPPAFLYRHRGRGPGSHHHP